MGSDEAGRGEPTDGARIPGDVPVKVGIGSYRYFQGWIDRELEELVARWAHAAAPIASRRSRRLRRGKPRRPR